MLRYRLSEAAQGDVLEILAWTHERFGQVARLRYENLSVAALRDIASQLTDRAFSCGPNWDRVPAVNDRGLRAPP